MYLYPFLFLGIVQGLTEFLPVSSSGHLIIARDLFGVVTPDGLAVDAVLQLATALAVLVYFRNDFWRLAEDAISWIRGRGVESGQKVMILAIMLGTIPAVIAGLLLESRMETIFRSAELVAWMLLAGSALLLLAEWTGKWIKEKKELSVWRGIGIGLYQCLALVPGVSRSGATIAGGLMLGLSRSEAARFGFLLSFPIILGSGLKKLLELGMHGELSQIGFPLLLGSLVAFTVGLGCIHFLIRFLKSNSLGIFILYRTLLALSILGFLYI